MAKCQQYIYIYISLNITKTEVVIFSRKGTVFDTDYN